MIDNNGDSADAPFKVLYWKGNMYICDEDTNETEELSGQVCWKAVNIEDAGIR